MTNIKISNRLLKIADMVDENSNIIDVGCDHALLDIYLSFNGLNGKIIASDITEGAVKQAKKNVSLYNANNVDVRIGDGLNTVKKTDNINTVIMSGLGNQKIVNILKENTNILKKVNTIIIQSNTGYSTIRKELNDMGYYIIDEALVKERDIIYVIIKFKKGKIIHSKKELYFGPVLLKNKNKLFKELIINEINKNKEIINKLPNKKIIKKFKLKIKNILLKKEIHY